MIKPEAFGLPEKFSEFRNKQLETAAKVNASKRYAYLLDAPTGIGKSLIAATVQKLSGKQAIYTCLTENNTVPTPMGFVPISEVQLGDRVMVGPNKSEQVTTLGSRQYDGDIFKIRSAYYPCECLETTPEHKVLVVRGGWSKEDISHRSKVMLRADHVKPGDYLVYPAVFGEPTHISFKDELIELCAWYIAEGYTDKSNRVFFALGEHEVENIERLTVLIEVVAGREAIVRSPFRSGVVVAMRADKEIAEFFAREFGRGAMNKRVPEWFFNLPIRQISIFLKAAMKGDGTSSVSHRAVSRTFYYKTASRMLSHQMRFLAAQCGYLPGIAPHYSKNPQDRSDIRPGWLISYRDSMVTNRGVRGYNDGTYMYLRVMETQRTPYFGMVYDISVPSQQFCTVSAIVHNCTTKQLQNQLVADFPYARTLMGRSNYRCLKYPNLFPDITAEECTHKPPANECEYSGRCPYMVAKHEALDAPLAVLNMSYFLSEANFVGMFSGRDLLIVDEFDTTEDQLMNYVEVLITTRMIERLDVPPPRFKTKFESWIEWANTTLRIIEPELHQLEDLTSGQGTWDLVDFQSLKRKRDLSRMVSKLRFFVKEVDKNWVWSAGADRWSFKPVWVNKYAHGVLWQHAKKVVGMSATILDPKQVASNTGLVLGERHYEYMEMASPFPKKNRPVYFEPCANVISREMDSALPAVANALRDIMNKHPDDHILVHTVSYKVRDAIIKTIKSKRLVTHGSRDRADVLDRFKASKQPLVLVSPSMDRGVDLPDEACRVVVICKCLPEEAKAVTPKGLKGWDELKVGDAVFTLSQEGIMEEQDVQRIYSEEYDGDMVTLKGTVMCQVTPDHRVLVHGWNTSKLEYVTPDKVLPKWHRIPYTGLWKGTGDLDLIDLRILADCPEEGKKQPRTFSSKHFLSLLGWYISEGHRAVTTKEKHGYCSWKTCITQKDDLNRQEICSLCDSMGLKYVVDYELGRPKRITISGRLLCEAIGACTPDGAHNKRIPRWVLNLPVEKLEPLFDALMKGDGSRQRGKAWAYITSSPGLCDDFCELCIKLGYSIKVYHMSSVKHEVYVRRQHTEFSVTGTAVSRYNGVVWCPTTQNGNWLAYWNGYYFFTGNCPYPDLGDPQTSRRVHASKDGNNWYAHKTISTIVQMAGRGVRSDTDYAITYILDNQFKRIYNEHRRMFPSWFKEAVVM